MRVKMGKKVEERAWNKCEILLDDVFSFSFLYFFLLFLLFFFVFYFFIYICIFFFLSPNNFSTIFVIEEPLSRTDDFRSDVYKTRKAKHITI